MFNEANTVEAFVRDVLCGTPTRYKLKVCRNAASVSFMGTEPMTRVMTIAATVAKLSAMITESDSKPDCLPSGVASAISTRLGWFARVKLLLIIASTICDKPVCKLSRCTTRAGRVLAVRKSELGNWASTMSPRL